MKELRLFFLRQSESRVNTKDSPLKKVSELIPPVSYSFYAFSVIPVHLRFFILDDFFNLYKPIYFYKRIAQ